MSFMDHEVRAGGESSVKRIFNLKTRLNFKRLSTFSSDNPQDYYEMLSIIMTEIVCVCVCVNLEKILQD